MAKSSMKYSGGREIMIVPLWSDNSYIKPLAKSINPFVQAHNLSEKFVVIYSGNLGAVHNAEILPELAALVKNPDILFLIIGEGDRKKIIAEKIQNLGLINCMMLPLQSVETIPFSFASADLAIVSLGTNASEHSLPSKTFNFMSAGLPLLCIAGEKSDLNRLVSKYDTGRCFTPDRLAEMKSFIEEVADDKSLQERFKANSLNASLNFSAENASVIARVLKNAINGNEK